MKILWSAEARADLQAIKRYIARDSEHYASLTVTRIIERIERAARAPTAGHRVHEFLERPLREVHAGNYRIIYRFTKVALDVVTIVHFRQTLPDERIGL